MAKKAIMAIKQKEWKGRQKGVMAVEIDKSKAEEEVNDQPLHEESVEMLVWSNMNVSLDDDEFCCNDVAEVTKLGGDNVADSGFIEIGVSSGTCD